MLIDKAIEILSLLNYKTIRLLSRDEMEAVKLGIEALKAYQKSQANGWYPLGYKLPGETEEQTVQRQGKDIVGNYSYEEAKQ